MKKIGFFILFLTGVKAYGSRGYMVDIPQDSMVYKTAQVAQSINNLNHSQVLILLLVTSIYILLFGMAVYHIVRRLIRIGRAYREFISSKWIDETDAHLRKAKEPDFSLAMFTEQQWLLNQLLSQDHEDGDAHDFADLPHDWWS